MVLDTTQQQDLIRILTSLHIMLQHAVILKYPRDPKILLHTRQWIDFMSSQLDPQLELPFRRTYGRQE